VHLKPLLARYTPSLLGIRQNTRLADERSGKEGGGEGRGGGAIDNSKLSSSSNSRSMGGRSAAKSKSKQPFGILTEMELEDRYNEEAAIVRPVAESESQTNLKAVTVGGSSSDDGDGYYRTEEGSRDGDRQQQAGTGIQKTTQFTVSYGDREEGDTYPQRVSDVGRGF
jgi:hypothetical protein